MQLDLQQNQGFPFTASTSFFAGPGGTIVDAASFFALLFQAHSPSVDDHDEDVTDVCVPALSADSCAVEGGVTAFEAMGDDALTLLGEDAAAISLCKYVSKR